MNMVKYQSKIVRGISQNWLLFSLVYFVIMVTISTFNFPPQVFSDSASYRGADGFSNYSWISFSGREYSRGWPIILLYSIFNTDQSRIISQNCLYFFSVNVFAYSLFRLRIKDKKYLNLAIFSMIIAITNPMMLWNNYISRESLTLSLTILCSALLILHQTASNHKNATLLFVIHSLISSFAIIVKPAIIPFILLLVLLHSYFYLLKYRMNRIQGKTLFSIAILSTTIISYGLWNVSNQNAGWSYADPTGRTLQEISYAYTISDLNPGSSGFLQALEDKNVSKCFVPELPLNTSENLGLPMEIAAEYREKCLNFSSWIRQRYTNDYFEYLLSNPKSVASTLTELFPGSFAFIGDGKTMTPIPDHLSNALFLNFFGISEYSFITLLGLFLLSTLILNLSNRKSMHKFLHSASTIPISLFVSLMTSIIASNILQPTHFGDLSRQSHTSNVFLRLIVLWQIFELIINWRRNSILKK